MEGLPLLLFPAGTLDLRRPALRKPVGDGSAIGFIRCPLARILGALGARLAGGILRPHQLSIEAVGAGGWPELVFFKIPPGEVVLPGFSLAGEPAGGELALVVGAVNRVPGISARRLLRLGKNLLGTLRRGCRRQA